MTQTLTLTTEQLKALRDALKSWQDGYDPVDDQEQYQMFVSAESAVSELLANREAQPVAWTDAQELRDVEKDGCGYLFKANPITPHADPRRVIKLYTAPPAPAVPPEKKLPELMMASYHEAIGWNACRAAMLDQPVSQGCDWTYDEHDYKWDSGCGEAWMFSDGGPTENGVKFCQSCGKPVLLAAAPEGGNEK